MSNAFDMSALKAFGTRNTEVGQSQPDPPAPVTPYIRPIDNSEVRSNNRQSNAFSMMSSQRFGSEYLKNGGERDDASEMD